MLPHAGSCLNPLLVELDVAARKLSLQALHNVVGGWDDVVGDLLYVGCGRGDEEGVGIHTQRGILAIVVFLLLIGGACGRSVKVLPTDSCVLHQLWPTCLL